MKNFLLLILAISTLFSPKHVMADGEIEINSWTELVRIGNDVNYPCGSASYILTRNLTSSDPDYATVAGPEAAFQSICNAGADFSNSTFDGQNYEIQDLVIDSTEGAGLFNDLEGATIKNLSLVDISVTGAADNIGGLARRTSGGVIENVHVSGTVTNGEGSDCTGGIIGSVEEATTISESSVNVNVSGFRYVGGLVGCSNYLEENETGATISQSYSEGEVSSMLGYAGGLVGSGYVTVISNSYSTVTITESGDRIGGLVGYLNESQVSKSYSDNGSMSGENYVGGLIGWAQSTTISDTYSRSNVSATGQFAGGLVGLLGSEFMGSIYNSYATGNVEGWYTIGGLVGGISYDDIHDSFSTGDMTLLESGAWIGGVFGDYQFDWTVDNVYWYKSDHNSALTCYSGGDCVGNSTAISTEQGLSYFYDASNEPLSGWNFTTVWLENESDYPTLRNMPVANDDPTSTSQNNNSSPSSSSGGWSAPGCSDSAPVLTPDLFQINTTSKSAKLFFTPIDASKFYISFSTKPNAEDYGEEVVLAKEGVQSHNIYLLKPNTIYYVKIRGQNGCMPGNWSNVMKFKTNSKIYYKNFSPRNLVSSFKKNVLVAEDNTEPTPNPPPELTPTPSPITFSTEGQNNSSLPGTQTAKKCFLWWCW